MGGPQKLSRIRLGLRFALSPGQSEADLLCTLARMQANRLSASMMAAATVLSVTSARFAPKNTPKESQRSDRLKVANRAIIPKRFHSGRDVPHGTPHLLS